MLLPVLRRHGCELSEDDYVDTYEDVSLEEKMAVDKALLAAGVPLSHAYLARTYGVEIEGQVN